MDDKNGNKNNGDLYADYIDKFSENGNGGTDGSAAPPAEEEVDVFIDRLRGSSSLDDMSAEKQASIMPDFTESESEREPVAPVDNADVVLVNDGGTTVFKADGALDDANEGDEKKKSSKKAAAKKGNNEKKDKKKKLVVTDEKGSTGIRILRGVVYVLCGLALVFCVVVIAAAMYLSKVTANDDALLDLNSFKLGQSTRIMAQDRETEEWKEYARIYGEENRVWVPYDQFPPELIKAVVASEDERFWNHNGVDVKRSVAAFINEYIFSIWDDTQGGSTITQQLIKNITEEDEVAGGSGALRKLREMYRAYQLERRFSKEQVLEAYLNTFRLSGQIAGIEAGANYYFNTTTQQLTTAQCAAIVCITKYPTANNPFVNPAENKSQRDWVIWKMYDLDMISEAEYNKAKAESEGFVFDTPGALAGSGTDVFSYFTDLVISSVMEDLQEYNGLTAGEAFDLLFNGGLVIYSTVDPFVQSVVERVALDEPEEGEKSIFPGLQYIETESQLEEERAFLNDADAAALQIGDLKVNQIQAAMVVMNYQGEVVGLAGGLHEKTESRGINRVTRLRSTGSVMKPVAVYAPAIEFNAIHYSSWFPDLPSENINGRPWPDNYSNTYGQYGFGVTVYDGVRYSLNTTSVFALKMIGADVSFDFLRTRLGITSLVDGKDNSLAPMATGSLTDGISPLELCAAYAVFGNGGVFTEAHCYSIVMDSRTQEVIIDKKSLLISNQAISEETAFIMNQLMQAVMNSGTGTNARPRGSMPYAGKTGTSSDFYDLWMCGMNPYYVCVTWMGYDYPKFYRPPYPRPTQAAFKAILEEISKDLPVISFPDRPSGVESMSFCPASGLIAGGACPNPMTGYYKDGNVPPGVCDHSPATIIEMPEE